MENETEAMNKEQKDKIIRAVEILAEIFSAMAMLYPLIKRPNAKKGG